jgi:hypothetical protein
LTLLDRVAADCSTASVDALIGAGHRMFGARGCSSNLECDGPEQDGQDGYDDCDDRPADKELCHMGSFPVLFFRRERFLGRGYNRSRPHFLQPFDNNAFTRLDSLFDDPQILIAFPRTGAESHFVAGITT